MKVQFLLVPHLHNFIRKHLDFHPFHKVSNIKLKGSQHLREGQVGNNGKSHQTTLAVSEPDERLEIKLVDFPTRVQDEP